MAIESYVSFTAEHLKNALKKRFLARLFKGIKTRPFCVEGHTGVGKTETIRQTAAELTAELPDYAVKNYPDHPTTKEILRRVENGTFVVTANPVNLSVVEPPDFQGMPAIVVDKNGEHQTVYGRPPLMPKQNDFALYFLDEINRSGRDVRNALLTMLQEERINGHILGDFTMMVAAMNPSNSEDGVSYEVQEFDAAFAGRLALLKFDANVKDFLNYLKSRWGAANPSVQFLIHHSDVIDFHGKSRANPRGLEAMIRALEVEGYDGDVFNIAAAEVGSEVAQVMMSFFNDPETIKGTEVVERYAADKAMQDKVKRCVKEDRTDFLGKLGNGVAEAVTLDIKNNDAKVRPEVITNIRAYLESLDNEACFAWFISFSNAVADDGKYREFCRALYGSCDKNSKLWKMYQNEKAARAKGKPQPVKEETKA